MNLLDQLSEGQRHILVSLPYRVGLMISQSDASGGDEASARELQVLSNILHGFAEDVFGAETVQHIISETINKSDCWGEWAQNMEAVPGECETAIGILRDLTHEKDIAAFRNHLMEIAEAVALAFHENAETTTFGEGMGQFFSYLRSNSFWSRRKDRYRRQSLHEYSSISVKERRALDALAKALGTTYV